jgi:hypothetical protein
MTEKGRQSHGKILRRLVREEFRSKAPEQNTFGSEIFNKVHFMNDFAGLGLVTPMNSGTRFLTASTVATAKVLNSSSSKL